MSRALRGKLDGKVRSLAGLKWEWGPEPLPEWFEWRGLRFRLQQDGPAIWETRIRGTRLVVELDGEGVVAMLTVKRAGWEQQFEAEGKSPGVALARLERALLRWSKEYYRRSEYLTLLYVDLPVPR
jgi:hypothetical protein